MKIDGNQIKVGNILEINKKLVESNQKRSILNLVKGGAYLTS